MPSTWLRSPRGSNRRRSSTGCDSSAATPRRAFSSRCRRRRGSSTSCCSTRPTLRLARPRSPNPGWAKKKTRRFRRVLNRSGRALEPFLDPCACDDLLAIAEAQAGADGSVLVPEAVEPRVDLVDLRSNLGVVLVGEPVPELGALFAQALDLLVDL